MTAAVGGELEPGNRMQALHDKGRNAVEENFVTIPCNHSKMIYGTTVNASSFLANT